MLASGLELLKALLPSRITESHHTDESNITTINMNNKYEVEIEQLPLTPFCCVSAIPSSFRYLAELLPASTSHNVLAKPLTSTPLLTAFLLYVTNCYHNPHQPRPKETIRLSATNLYYAIVQLTIVKSNPVSSEASKFAASSGKLPRAAHLPSSLRRNTISRFAAVGEGFTDIQLDGPSSSSSPTPLSFPSFSLPASSSSSSSSPSKAAPQDKNTTTTTTTRYFVPIENSRETTILNPDQRLKGKAWKEIPASDAMESLRPPGSGICIGDGENWRELTGVERLGCVSHGCVFDLRVWVKEL